MISLSELANPLGIESHRIHTACEKIIFGFELATKLEFFES